MWERASWSEKGHKCVTVSSLGFHPTKKISFHISHGPNTKQWLGSFLPERRKGSVLFLPKCLTRFDRSEDGWVTAGGLSGIAGRSVFKWNLRRFCSNVIRWGSCLETRKRLCNNGDAAFSNFWRQLQQFSRNEILNLFSYPKHQAEEEEDGLGDDDSAVHVCVEELRQDWRGALVHSVWGAAPICCAPLTPGHKVSQSDCADGDHTVTCCLRGVPSPHTHAHTLTMGLGRRILYALIKSYHK